MGYPRYSEHELYSRDMVPTLPVIDNISRIFRLRLTYVYLVRQRFSYRAVQWPDAERGVEQRLHWTIVIYNLFKEGGRCNHNQWFRPLGYS
jgi:hypothetical protein